MQFQIPKNDIPLIIDKFAIYTAYNQVLLREMEQKQKELINAFQKY